MELKCMICFDDDRKLLTLPCGCRACRDCLFSWSKSYCEDNVFANEILLPCPFDYCRKPMRPEQFIPLLDPQQAETINQYLLQHYLSHQKDIRTCPRRNCDFAGIAGYLPKNCNNYVCPKCGTSWKDQSQITAGDRFKTWINKGLIIKNELLSNLVKLLMGNYCPNCSTHITKNGGCQHMVCTKCKYEFCWFCLDNYYGYRHSGTRPCGLRPFYITFMLLFLFFPLISRMSINFPVFNMILSPVWYFLGRTPLVILEFLGTFVLPTTGMVSLCELLRLRRNYYTKAQILLGVTLYTLLTGAYIAFNYTLYAYSMLMEVWRLIFYCALIIAIGTVTGVIFGKGMDELMCKRLTSALVYFNSTLCILCLILYFYFGYYPMIMLFLFIELGLILYLLAKVNGLCKPVNWRRYGCSRLSEKRMLILCIGALLIYNALLIWYKHTIVYKLLAYLACASGLTFGWWRMKMVRLPSFLGILAAGTFLYFKYVI